MKVKAKPSSMVLGEYRVLETMNSNRYPHPLSSPRVKWSSILYWFYLLVSLFPMTLFAHPMGNFSISHYSKIQIAAQAVDLLYIIDMAEIPTFQEKSNIDGNSNGQIETSEQNRYLANKVEELTQNIALLLDGRQIILQRQSQTLHFIPGGFDLPTMKITVTFRGDIPLRASSETMTLSYEDRNFRERLGWKEIVAQPGDGVVFVDSSVPANDRTSELSIYPQESNAPPPQELTASIRFKVTMQPPALASSGNEPEKESDQARTATAFQRSDPKTQNEQQRLVQLLSKSALSTSIVLLALIVAFSLGAFHALSPGHGKTVVGAYLVGTRGTAKHAMLLGAIVTITHTAGVFILGLITLYASRYVLPEKLYPWLGFVSGLGVVVIGFGLFLQRYRNLHSHAHGGNLHSHAHHDANTHTHLHHDANGHAHAHVHSYEHTHSELNLEHEHSHGPFVHSHGSGVHSHDYSKVKFKDLLTLGVTGGMVPCPSALVVLLSAISINRVGLGLLLIIAFSLGLALVLMAIGMMMIYARGFLEKFTGEGRLWKTLPVFSSLVVTGLGAIIAIQSLINGGIIEVSFSGMK
jgi:nickel/cobalt transporter (NicO) family protein